VKKSNDKVLAGRVPFRARERCWPVGVPGFDAYSPVAAFYFIQMPEMVTIVNAAGPEIRHFELAPPSQNLKPPWYGVSVGHYESGDARVVDAIALNDRTFIDNHRTLHTGKLHAVEHLTLTDGGRAIDISLTVDNPGAFTTAAPATQRWMQVDRGPMGENLCNETNEDILNRRPDPESRQADF
jgi:hypothetical protein